MLLYFYRRLCYFFKFTNQRFLLDYEDGFVVSVVAPGVDVKLAILGVNGDLDIRIRGGGRSVRGLGKLEKNGLIRME